MVAYHCKAKVLINNMTFQLIGLNHTTAPVALRERLFFGTGMLPTLLKELVMLPGIDEVAILSTCNRTEIVCSGDDAAPVVGWLAQHAHMAADELLPHLYQHTDREAMAHLFRVASGLDSQVIGETQILKQLRDALEIACEQHVVGKTLSCVLQQALATGKRARTVTAISEGTFSIGRAGVELVHSLFPALHESPVLMLGAGKISELTARHLADNGVKTIFVANRTHAHAEELAGRLGGQAIHYSELAATLVEVDILISSTSAPHYVLLADEITSTMHVRHGRPLCLIDLAVPRDIEPAAGEIPGVHLFNIDDLRDVADSNADLRRAEIPKVEAIINESIVRCRHRLAGQDAAGAIVGLRESFERVRQEELARNASLLSNVTQEQRTAIEAMTDALVKKLLHIPTVRLKELLASVPGQQKDEMVCKLFYDTEDPE